MDTGLFCLVLLELPESQFDKYASRDKCLQEHGTLRNTATTHAACLIVQYVQNCAFCKLSECIYMFLISTRINSDYHLKMRGSGEGEKRAWKHFHAGGEERHFVTAVQASPARPSDGRW